MHFRIPDLNHLDVVSSFCCDNQKTSSNIAKYLEKGAKSLLVENQGIRLPCRSPKVAPAILFF